jgi:acetate kinase
MTPLLLVINIGSASLKAAVFALATPDAARFRLRVDLASGRTQGEGEVPAALRQDFEANADITELVALIASNAADGNGRLVAVAHRIQHGGHQRQPQPVTPALLQELQELEVFCPLHQPPALEAVCHLRELWPALPQFAVFDTSFHRRQPVLASTYALPAALRMQGIHAYGFHGISCQHVLHTLATQHAGLADGRVLIAHLGQSASLTAVHAGESIACSTGFSTLEGLPMGTRCGQLDPGVLLYLLELGWSKSRLTDLLYHKSGLLGLSGVSADLHELLASRSEGAQFAVDYFCYRAARIAASLACAMEGLDTLVFTGSAAENEAVLREKICARLAWLDVVLDTHANRRGQGRLGAPGSRCEILIVPCDEEAEISRQCSALAQACTMPAAKAAGA